jgi:hypothetical protein
MKSVSQLYFIGQALVKSASQDYFTGQAPKIPPKAGKPALQAGRPRKAGQIFCLVCPSVSLPSRLTYHHRKS